MPAKHNFTIIQGSTFHLSLVYNDSNGDPVDMTGFDARMEFRDADGNLQAYIDSSEGSLLLGNDGTIVGDISASATAAITAKKGRFDLELTSDLTDLNNERIRSRLLEGTWSLSKEVTTGD